MEVIHGLRVVHSHHVRPSKGGVMFDLGMTEDETGALACLNSLRVRARALFSASLFLVSVLERSWSEGFPLLFFFCLFVVCG